MLRPSLSAPGARPGPADLAPISLPRDSMTRLYKYFFRGLITVLPLALTIYLLYIFLAWTEAVALTFLRPFIGGFYFPAWACCWASSASWRSATWCPRNASSA